MSHTTVNIEIKTEKKTNYFRLLSKDLVFLILAQTTAPIFSREIREIYSNNPNLIMKNNTLKKLSNHYKKKPTYFKLAHLKPTPAILTLLNNMKDKLIPLIKEKSVPLNIVEHFLDALISNQINMTKFDFDLLTFKKTSDFNYLGESRLSKEKSQGTIIYTNDDKYSSYRGECKNGLPDGSGILISINLTIIEGTFKKGKPVNITQTPFSLNKSIGT